MRKLAALLLALAFAVPSWAGTADHTPDQLPENSPTQVTATFPDLRVAIDSVISATIQPPMTGSITVVGNDDTTVESTVTLTGAASQVQVVYDLLLVDSSTVQCVGTLNLQQGQPLTITITNPPGITNSGDQVTVTNPDVDSTGEVSPNAGQTVTVEVFHLNANTSQQATVNPNGGVFEFFTGLFSLVPGPNDFLVVATDPNCPACEAEFEYTVVFDDGTPQNPVFAPQQAMGKPQLYNNEARQIVQEAVGPGPDAGEECAGTVSQTRVTAPGETWEIALPVPGIELSDGCNYWGDTFELDLPGNECPVCPKPVYSSCLDTNWTMGQKWTHSYIQRISEGPGGTVRRYDGRAARLDTFVSYAPPPPPGGSSAPQALTAGQLYESPGTPNMMRDNGDGTFTVRSPSGLKYHYRQFEPAGGGPVGGPADVPPGACFAIESPHGNTKVLEYDVTFNRLVRVKDTYGAVALEWFYKPGTNLIERIRDLTGRETTLGYDAEDRLETITLPATDDFPAGRTRRFEYVPGTALLAKVFFPNEVAAGINEARYEYTYYPDGRIHTQKIGGTNASGVAAGGTTTFEYGTRPDLTPFTRITNRRGFVVEYDFSPEGRVIKRTVFTGPKRTNGPFITTFAYNANGYLIECVKPEGNKVVCTYPASPANPFEIGNRLTCTSIADATRGGDQLTITTRTEYEPVFQAPKRIIDPRKQELDEDNEYTVPFGDVQAMETTIVYEYQEGATVPAPEQGWGLNEAAAELNEPDRNGNGVASSCSTVQSIQLPSTTLPDGTVQTRQILQGHNAFGRLVFSEDAAGVRTVYEYHPESDVDGSGSFTIPSADNVTGGFLKKVTTGTTATALYGPAIPIEVTMTFVRNGALTTVTDGRGVVHTTVRNALRFVRETTAATDTSLVPSRANEAGPIPALNIVRRITYDANGNVTLVEVDNRDNNLSHNGAFIKVAETVYDILDNPLTIKAEKGEGETVQTTIVYDANENPIQVTGTKVPHVHTSMAYDSRDIVCEMTSGLGTEQSAYTNEIDKNGNITKIISPVDRPKGPNTPADGNLDEILRTIYDGHDRPTTQVNALGSRARVIYDPASNVIQSRFRGHPRKDPTGANILLQKAFMTHDEAGRLVKTGVKLFVDDVTATQVNRTPVLDTDNPDSNQEVETLAFYDVNSLLAKSVTKNQGLGDQVSTILRDAHYRVREATGPLGNKVAVLYNNAHQPTTVTATDVQPDGLTADEIFTSMTEYDAIGRPIRTIDPKGDDAQIFWGTLVARRFKDRMGNVSRIRRDGLLRVTRTRRFLTTTGDGSGALDTSNPANPDGCIDVVTRYKDDDNEIHLLDDLNNKTKYLYDSRQNVFRTVFADSTFVQRTFGLDNLADSVTDNSGNVFTNTHDILGRLIQVDIARAAGFVGTTQQTFAYDGLGRLACSTDNGGTAADLAFTSTLECFYSSLNKIEEVHNGRIVSRQFKSYGDPTKLVYPDGSELSYTTDKLDRLTQIDDASGLVAKWDYIGSRYHKMKRGNDTVTAYTWDDNRRLKRVKHRLNGNVFLDYKAGYNKEDYLIWQRREHLANGKGEWLRLDSAYRILQRENGVDNPETMTGTGDLSSESWVLDGLGNWNSYIRDGVTKLGVANDMNEYTSFGGDSIGHNDNGDRTSDPGRFYEWDALGRLRRVTAAGGGVESTHAYHADNRRTRRVGAGATSSYSWAGVQMIHEGSTAGADLLTIGGLMPLRQAGLAGGDQYYHLDCKSWIAGTTVGAAATPSSHFHTAYGKELSGATPGSWSWQGHFREGDGRDYVINRFYDREQGRWLSRDPLGFVDGLNLPSAFNNNPVASWDPMGLELAVGKTSTSGDGRSRTAIINRNKCWMTGKVTERVLGHWYPDTKTFQMPGGTEWSRSRFWTFTRQHGGLDGLLIGFSMTSGDLAKEATDLGCSAIKTLSELPGNIKKGSAQVWQRSVESDHLADSIPWQLGQALVQAPVLVGADWWYATPGERIKLAGEAYAGAAAGEGVRRAVKGLVGPRQPRSDGVTMGGTISFSGDILERQKLIAPLDGYTDVVIHGHQGVGFLLKFKPLKGPPLGIMVSPKQLAAWIRKAGHKGNIRLIACHSAAHGVAAELARLLRVKVVAPTNSVTITEAGKLWMHGGVWVEFEP